MHPSKYSFCLWGWDGNPQQHSETRLWIIDVPNQKIRNNNLNA